MNTYNIAIYLDYTKLIECNSEEGLAKAEYLGVIWGYRLDMGCEMGADYHAGLTSLYCTNKLLGPLTFEPTE